MDFDPSFTAPSVTLLFPQPPQTAQPCQDPCLDWDNAVHQKAPGVLALQHPHHSPWGTIVGFLEPTENLLKDHSAPLATTNGQKLAQITSDLHFKENPTKSGILSVMENHSAVAKIPNRAGRGGSAGAAAGSRSSRASPVPGWGWQQQRAAGVISAAWRSWSHLARLRSALGAARRSHLENFHSRAEVCAAGSCCCSAASPNIPASALARSCSHSSPPLTCPRIIFHPSSAIQPLWLQNLSQCCW